MGPSDSDSLKRRRIDRYELHELIGEGGMGAVYRATDSRLGRTVALKTVVSHRSGDGLTNELRQRFMREALAASKVDHRNVVQVIDFGVTPDGTPYLVMEYLRGRDLGVVLRKAKEPMSVAYVADVMLCVCAALRACHQQGVVHRDLKPSNIFLADTDTGPEIKVLDFGVSKAPMAGDLTQEGQILGTPQYLSPEQVNGKVGPASDQYALGVLLYVCLTKKLPFEEHQNLSLLRAIEVGRFQGPRAHRPDIPPTLEAIVLRAMHADPAARFPSVHALGQALWSFASSRGQVEWKNYYFQTPPVDEPGQETLRSFPPASAARSAPPTTVDPTAMLQPSVSAAAGVPEAMSPQLFISTKLASATPGDRETPAPVPTVSWRRWAALGVTAGLIVAAVSVGYRGLGVGAASSPAAPIASPAKEPVSKLTAPPLPVPTRAPEPIRPEQAKDLVPAAVSPPSPQPASSRPRRHLAARKGYPTQADEPAKTTGLDKNGIGIPSN